MEVGSSGYIKLYRKLLDDALWKSGTPEQKTIMITLLLMASHKESEWIWQGQKYQAQPGQFVTSLDGIARRCGKGISVKNIRTTLKNLENCGFLANQPTKTGRLITIANWGFYQSQDEQSAKQTAKTGQRPGKDPAPIKNDKNDKNIYLPDLFTQFWKAYPVKSSKQTALKAFNKIAPTPELFSQIMEAVENQQKASAQKKEKGEFTPDSPYAAKWLSGKRWEDDISREPTQTSTEGDGLPWR